MRLIDRLQKEGLVVRSQWADRRIVEISLTELGVAKAEKVIQVRQQKLAGLASLLSRSELLAFQKIAYKLLGHLTTDLQSAEHNCRLCDEQACDLCECSVEQKYVQFDGFINSIKS